MSNKEHEKLDGVFDTSAVGKGEKIAANADKPARPPKPKTSLSRETKVGLAVIAALLVIFVIVLVVRLGGESGEPVAKGDSATDNGAADAGNAAKEQPKTTPAAGRTLIAQSGAPKQPQYLFDKPSGASNGAAAGSAYGAPGYAVAKGPQGPAGPIAGYVPPSIGQAASSGSAAASDLQSEAAVNSDNDQAPRLNQFGMQDHDRKGVRAGGAPSAKVANPFASRITLGQGTDSSAPDNQSIASDEADADEPAASTAGAAADGAGKPFDIRASKGFGNGLSQGSSNGIEQPSDLQQPDRQMKNSTAAGGFRNMTERATAGDIELGEAERFNTNELRSTAAASRVVGNASGRNSNDAGQAAFDSEADGGKKRPLERIEFAHGQQNVESAPGELSANEKPPFRAPGRPAVEPAPLDDAVLGANAEAPAPIRGEPLSDEAEAYVVAADDTYWTIAKRTYGSGAYFKALYEHNRRRLKNADSLRPGTQLMLPNEATLQRLYPTLCPKPQRLAAASRASRASFNSQTSGNGYVVSEGDTLYDVARRRLGNASRWAEVYELNRDAIGAATDRLEHGTRLVLPAKE